MKTVFDKLNLKNVKQIPALNPPAGFAAELSRLEGVAILRDAGAAERVEFALAFVTTCAEIEAIAPVREAARSGTIKDACYGTIAR